MRRLVLLALLALWPGSAYPIGLFSSTATKIIVRSDCDNTACASTGQVCITATTLYCCNQAGGNYDACSGGGGGSGDINTVGNCASGDCLVDGVTGSALTFEGSSDNAFETTFSVVDPTADRTINLPNASGTILTDGSLTLTGDVTTSAGLATTIAANAVALTTDTTGDYVSSATSSGGLTMTGTEGASLGVLLPAATDALSSTTSSGSGLQLISAGLTMLQGCSDGQILKWTESTDLWGCAADTSGGTPSFDTITTGTNSTATMTIASGGTMAFTTGVLAIPNGTAPTVDATGECAMDTTTGQLVCYSGSVKVYASSQCKGLDIESPTTSTDPILFKAPFALTITDIDCIVDPADTSESVTLLLNECNSSGDSCAGIDGSTTIVCDNDGAADDGSLSNGGVASGGWITLDISAVSGTVTRVGMTFCFTEDRQ